VASEAACFATASNSAERDVGTDRAQLNGHLGPRRAYRFAHRILALHNGISLGCKGLHPKKERDSLPSWVIWSVYGVGKYDCGPPLLLLWVITLAPLPVDALDKAFEDGWFAMTEGRCGPNVGVNWDLGGCGCNC
jgi:hypothetical protein